MNLWRVDWECMVPKEAFREASRSSIYTFTIFEPFQLPFHATRGGSHPI